MISDRSHPYLKSPNTIKPERAYKDSISRVKAVWEISRAACSKVLSFDRSYDRSNLHPYPCLAYWFRYYGFLSEVTSAEFLCIGSIIEVTVSRSFSIGEKSMGKVKGYIRAKRRI